MVLPVLLHCPKVSVRLVGARPSEVEDLGTDVAVAVIVVGIMFMVWVNRSPPRPDHRSASGSQQLSSIGGHVDRLGLPVGWALLSRVAKDTVKNVIFWGFWAWVVIAL